MKTIKLLFLAAILSFTTTSFAQQFSVGGAFGYTKPIDKYLDSDLSFEDGLGPLSGIYAQNGINCELDALYHPKFANNNWGIGLTVSYNTFFFTDDIYKADENYKRYMYGVKTVYKFNMKNSIKPFVGLSYCRGYHIYPQVFYKETSEERQYTYRTINYGSISLFLGLEYKNFDAKLFYFAEEYYGLGIFALGFNLGYRFYFGK